MTKLWKQTGCINTFKEFCEDFNQKKSFKNFAGGTALAQDDDIGMVTKFAHPPATDEQSAVTAVPVIPAAVQSSFDKKQQILYFSIGVALGIVSVMALKHLRK